MIFLIKKTIFNYIIENWQSTKTYLRIEKSVPGENNFSRLQLLNLSKIPCRNKDQPRYSGLLSFSIYEKKVDNIYHLDELVSEFLERFQNKTFSTSEVVIEFFEIDVVELTEKKRVDVSAETIIEYRVLTIPFTAEQII